MMRRILPVALSCVAGCMLLAVPAFPQRGGGHGGGGFRSGGGFHGGAGFGGARGFRGERGFRGSRNFYGYGGYYPGLWGWGWYDPFLWDWDTDFEDEGYGYPAENAYPSYNYGPGYGGSPSVMIISNNPPTPPAQPVVIEVPQQAQAQSPAVPSTAQAPHLQKYQEPLYLVAMNDGIIRAVLAYWVNGSQLHYVTMDHMEKQVPLRSVDRSLSERLNRERNVQFRLPG
jgi:hypothetical protein